MTNEELGTKLGDLNAILADIVRDTGSVEVAQAYKISNELYSEFVQYDQEA